jgi:DNA (cytosine-5)-methyltransferase 1
MYVNRKPIIIDLYCGAGGAAMGYHQAGFEVVGVDIKPQPNYPFKFHQADAIEYFLQHYREFDAAHASPPCQKFTSLNKLNVSRWKFQNDHPDLVDVTRQSLTHSGLPYIIENVQGSPLLGYVILRGAMFGLGVDRPRLFESNILLLVKKATRQGNVVGVYGKLDGRRVFGKPGGKISRAARGLTEAREAMGIDWMDDGEIQLAIPPAYTRFIGEQLLRHIDRTLKSV